MGSVLKVVHTTNDCYPDLLYISGQRVDCRIGVQHHPHNLLERDLLYLAKRDVGHDDGAKRLAMQDYTVGILRSQNRRQSSCHNAKGCLANLSFWLQG